MPATTIAAQIRCRILGSIPKTAVPKYNSLGRVVPVMVTGGRRYARDHGFDVKGVTGGKGLLSTIIPTRHRALSGLRGLRLRPWIDQRMHLYVADGVFNGPPRATRTRRVSHAVYRLRYVGR